MRLTIPDDIRFADLHLSRPALGQVAFDWRPIEAICTASGIDVSVFRDRHEDNVAGLIVTWYRSARANGEPADPVADALIREAWSEIN